MLDEYPEQLIVCEHHWSDDLEIPWTDARGDFYGVSGTPHVRIDGKYLQVGATSCTSAADDYRALIAQRLAETGSVSPVSASGGLAVSAGEASLIATFVLEDDVDLGAVRAVLVLRENPVSYGGTDYHRVTRAGSTLPVTLLEAGDHATVAATFTLDPGWDADNLSAVAFLQHFGGDLEVYQGLRLQRVADVAAENNPSPATRLLSVHPQPMAMGAAGVGATIRMRLSAAAASGPLELALFDGSGRRVQTLLAAGAGALTGRSLLEVGWDGRDQDGRAAPAGVYFLRLSSREGVAGRTLVAVR